MPRFSLRTLIVMFSGCCVAFAIAAIAGRQVKPSYVYAIRAQFTDYPSDDERLVRWLEEQPGCFRVGVDREPDAIRVYWIMSRDLFGNPPPPRVEEQFRELGYGELKSFVPDWIDH